MGFLRRLLGGGAGEPEEAAPAEPPASQAELEAFEQERERQLLREESERHDELRQRQLRYAQYAWTPPAQGGPERAEDADAPRDE